MDLGRVDSVAHVMAFTVCYMCDQAFRFAKLLADQFYDIDVFHLVMSAYIVNLAYTSFVDDQVDGTAVILNIEPVADIFTLSVNREWFVVQSVGDHQRDQLFREVIRAVVVGAAADGHRQAVGSVVCENKKVSTCFGGAVRAACMDRSFLCEEEVRSVKRKISVNLICGNLMITLDSVFTAGIHENSSTLDVGVKEYLRVFDGTVYVALSCEVYHDVRMLLLEKLVNSVTVCDAFLYKAEVRFVHDRCKSGKVSGIGQAVQAYDTVIRMSLHHMKNKVASDKSGAAGNDDCHKKSPL